VPVEEEERPAPLRSMPVKVVGPSVDDEEGELELPPAPAPADFFVGVVGAALEEAAEERRPLALLARRWICSLLLTVSKGSERSKLAVLMHSSANAYDTGEEVGSTLMKRSISRGDARFRKGRMLKSRRAGKMR
jgi:hypothetical protein